MTEFEKKIFILDKADKEFYKNRKIVNLYLNEHEDEIFDEFLKSNEKEKFIQAVFDGIGSSRYFSKFMNEVTRLINDDKLNNNDKQMILFFICNNVKLFFLFKTSTS